MNLKLLLSFCFLISYSLVTGQGTDYSKCYCGQGGRYLELGTELQATSYLGSSERIELEISGGGYGDYSQHVYLIESRGGVEVEAYQIGGSVNNYDLKIYDNGNASNSPDKYKIGVLIPSGEWRCICIRARELRSNSWLAINDLPPTSTPSLPEVAFGVQWLFKSQENGDFTTVGNLGVGTESPTHNLHVNGHGVFKDGSVVDIALTTPGGKNGIALSPNTYGNYSRFDIYNQDDPTISERFLNFKFNQDATGLSIKKGGNVGIGTTTPTHKLEVNGTIRAKEVKVEASPWPDFVFSSDYELMPLEEIEKFIQSNHHLPEIPSAQEIEANGVQLGEMNSLLLKKIEELTLHLIEVNKENATLRQQLKANSQSQKETMDMVLQLQKEIKRINQN